MSHKSEQESNNDTYMNRKKTKKKKKKHDYSFINDINYIQEDYSVSSSNINIDSRKKKKIYIEDENKLYVFQKDYSSYADENEGNFLKPLKSSNNNKIMKKELKKKKKKINHNNYINESIENYNDATELNEIVFPNSNTERKKEDRRSNDLHYEQENENIVYNDCCIENENILNNNFSEHTNVNPIENEHMDEGPILNNANVYDESNIFKKIFNRIKRTIIERKGNPITNENVVENDACELSIIDNNRNEQNNNDNEQNSIDEEIYVLNRQLDDYNGNVRENINEQNEVSEIINLNELNPNDVLNNMILERQENETRSRILSNSELDNDITNNVNDDNNRNNNNNNNNDNNNNNYSYTFVSNNIVSYCKNYMKDIKEKIKKYWLDRVQEANTQLNTPHQTSNRPNTSSNEDESDDPSCLQILFFLGLVCKFPILWVIGSIIFCVTPNEHKRTKKWSLINSIFAFISIIYFIATSKFKVTKPAFFVVMNNNAENKNIFQKGIIKYNNTITKNTFILNEFLPQLWLSMNSKQVYKTGQTSFLNWNFVSSQRPNSNILLSSNVYKLLNRVQVTVFFGKGSIYPNEEIEKIKHFLKDLKKNMDPIPYEKITLTDNDIPDNFFGGGIRCEKVDNFVDKKENEKEKEKWYLFWKGNDEQDNESNDFTFPSFIPVGEIFFFKSEYNCRIAFIYPKNTNVERTDAPHNFVEIKKVIIKSF